MLQTLGFVYMFLGAVCDDLIVLMCGVFIFVAGLVEND